MIVNGLFKILTPQSPFLPPDKQIKSELYFFKISKSAPKYEDLDVCMN